MYQDDPTLTRGMSGAALSEAYGTNEPTVWPDSTWSRLAMKNKIFPSGQPEIRDATGHPALDADKMQRQDQAYRDMLTNSAGAAGIKNDYPGTNMGKLLGAEVKPWEMHPSDYAKHIQRVLGPRMEQEMGRGLAPTQAFREMTGAGVQDLINPASETTTPEEAFKKLHDYYLTSPVVSPYSDIGRNGMPSFINKTTSRNPGQEAFAWYQPSDHSITINQQTTQGYLPGKYTQQSLIGHEFGHAAQRNSPNVPEYIETPARNRFGETHDIVDAQGRPIRSGAGSTQMENLRATNPWAYHQMTSIGHFPDLGNYETDFVQRYLAEQALKDRMDVHPYLLKAFPTLQNVQPNNAWVAMPHNPLGKQ